MKITKEQLKAIINEELNNAKCASHMLHLKRAQADHERGDEHAFQEIQYQTEKMKALGCDMNKDYDKPENDKPEDQIRDLATGLESALLALEKEGKIDGGMKEKVTAMKEKATAIIDLINVHF